MLRFRAALEKKGAQGGDECERQNHRPQQSENHRPAHGPEHFSLDAPQRENGQVGGQNQDFAQNGGLSNLGRTGHDLFQSLFLGEVDPLPFPSVGQPTQAVLHDDDGTVYDQTEVDRPQTHQIGRNVEIVHSQGGRQHREGNCATHDQASAELEQEKKEQAHHQQAAFEQVGDGRAEGGIDQLGPIKKRFQATARR